MVNVAGLTEFRGIATEFRGIVTRCRGMYVIAEFTRFYSASYKVCLSRRQVGERTSLSVRLVRVRFRSSLRSARERFGHAEVSTVVE